MPEIKTPISASKKIEAIREFTSAGYPLIPLKGKIPIHKNWPETRPGQYGEKELADFNYGIALRSTDLVVDIDPRNFAPGDNPVTRLLADIGVPLKSFTVETGGGGYHIYLKIPAGTLVCNSLKAYPGIEFKSIGRQVVGPGSIHPESGREYTIASDRPPLALSLEAPEGLLRLIRKPAVPYFEVNQGTGSYKNDAETQGRFISYLQDVAEISVEGKGGDLNAFKVAAQGRDLALPPAVTWELMLELWNPRCAPPWDAEELKAKVINAYRYAKGSVGASHPSVDFKEPLPPSSTPLNAKEEEFNWVLTKQGGIVKCFYNLLNYLRLPSTGLRGIFGYNQFTGQIDIINPAPWHKGIMPAHPAVNDHDLKLLKGHLAVKENFEMPVTTLEEAVTITADANKFHPVREYLESLKWDGRLRLDTWLHDYAGAKDDEYTRACARKTLCAAVMRVMRPGCKFDSVLVLEGEQDIGKSAICKILGGEWSGDFSVDPRNKDTIQLMQGQWIIELAELEFTRKTDTDAIKAFLTRQTDKARLAYGRLAMEFPRQSIFIATKNPEADGAYLKDDSGNRRWWPVSLRPRGGQVDFRGLKDVRNQLFAEAMERVRMKGGERLDMETKELKEIAKGVVGRRHAEHPWTERIATWLEALPPERDFLTAREVFIEALAGLDKQLDRRVTVAIATVMRDLGWHSGVRRMQERVVRGYSRVNPERYPLWRKEDELASFLGEEKTDIDIFGGGN